MPEFSVTRTIEAPVAAVWNELADFGNIVAWNPGVTESYLTSEQESGVGTTRHCSLAPLGAIQERIMSWEPHRRLEINIYEFSRLPMRDAHADFRLRDLGGARTEVEIHYRYEPSRLGKLIPAAYFQSQLERGMGALLKGLDQHVTPAQRS